MKIFFEENNLSSYLIFIFCEILFLDYYKLVNETVNNISHKSNANSLSKLKNISTEKDELVQTAKLNAREAR